MYRRGFAKKKNEEKEIALERIHTLFCEAKKAPQELANRYVFLARKIGTKIKVRIPQEYKQLFCKTCGAYWHPEKNVRIRLSAGKIVYFCKECETYRRVPYKPRRPRT